jgi:PAS domain S-box-containing protein
LGPNATIYPIKRENWLQKPIIFKFVYRKDLNMNFEEIVSYQSETAIICLSEGHAILALNKFAKEFFELSQQDVFQINFFALCNKEDIQLPFNASDITEKSVNPKFSLGNAIFKNGKEILTEWKVVYCHPSDWEKPGFIILMRTVQAQDENKISSLLHLKDIVENLPEYIYWKDLNLNYQGCNKQVAKYLGLNSPGEIVGKSDLDFDWSDKRIKKLHKADQKVIIKKIKITFEEEIPKSKSLDRIMLTSKSPLFDKEGDVIGVLGVSTDITELKRTKQKLMLTKNKLAAMTLLSSSIAHELRTPFASLNLGVVGIHSILPDLIKTYNVARKSNLKIPKIDDLKFSLLNDALTDMSNEIQAAFTFIDMLLVKLNPSISAKNEEIFSINQCIHFALEKYPFEEDQRELINLNLSEDFNVRGDLILVSHIFLNLLKNSLYYIAASGKGEIFITLEKNHLYNKVHFKDTGSGIPASFLPKIFTQFFSQTYHGTGIGLAFCKKVMQSLHGDITCESVEGEYTLFILSFPSMEKRKERKIKDA